MLLEQLRLLIRKIAECYQRLEHYFTSGSFAIKFYPFLMHPCVRNTRSFTIKVFSVVLIFTGLYYFFGELISILFSDVGLSSYTKHTTIELLLPKDFVVNEKSGSLTPLFYTMQLAFQLQAWNFILGYIICVTYITGQKLRLLSVLFSLLFSIGSSIIAASQGGHYSTFGYLQNLGFEVTFLIGNLAMVAIGFAINNNHIKRFKYYSIIAGLIGLSCIISTVFITTAYTPWLERISIYSLMIWEISLGFAVLKAMESK